MIPSTSEASHDAVAIARALGRGNKDGAWAVFAPKTSDERVALVACLATLLAHVVGDDDDAWRELVDIAVRTPR